MLFEASVDIAADPAAVWAVYMDVERWPEWTDSVTAVQRLDQGPIHVGSRTRVRQPRLPTAVWTVTSLEPGRSFAWEATGPGLRTVGTHLVEATPTCARATERLEQLGPLGGIMGRLTKGLTDRYLTMETAGLKARCEGGASG